MSLFTKFKNQLLHKKSDDFDDDFSADESEEEEQQEEAPKYYASDEKSSKKEQIPTKRKVLRGVLAAVLIGSCFYTYSQYRNNFAPKKAEDFNSGVTTAANTPINDTQSAKNNVAPDDNHIVTNVFPFWTPEDDKKVKEMAEANKPAKPNTSSLPNRGSVPLPAIPDGSSYIGSVPVPEIPNGSAPYGGAVSKPLGVQGVIVGHNGASAILSDGSVVSEGEELNGDRIAFIGGDGIHFDSGNVMKY